MLLNDMFIYGYDASYINDFEKNVKLVTPAKAKEIIAKYFSKDKLHFLFIGKADEIREGAKKYGTVIEKEIKEDNYEINGKKNFDNKLLSRQLRPETTIVYSLMSIFAASIQVSPSKRR